MALDQVDVDNYEEQVEKEMSFLDHLEELRWHLVRAVSSIVVVGTIVFLAKDFVFDTVLFGPRNDDFWSYQGICNLSELLGMGDVLCLEPTIFKIIATEFGERFIVHIKVSIMLGFVIAFPYIFYQFWSFIAPGLYDKERKAARGVVFICSSLFIMGVLFGYFIISPFAVNFLAGYEIQGVEATTSLASYVSYMMMFTIPTGIIFELPVVVYFLAKVGLVTADFMRTYRRHAVVVILVMAALITPPDVVTQFLIGIPLYFLYEISILIAGRVEKKNELAMR
ncbi:MAG: sec-independent protein translocase protein TatC [Paraglaciecola sp.]|jgi:sec-independent protein translocase protein TatC